MTEQKPPDNSLLTTLLKGSGQVIFCDHPVTGLLFLLGIAWGSWTAGNIWVFLGACVGLMASTLTAYWLELDRDARNAGLYGYNGILVGAALPTFLHPEWRLWILLMVAAAVSTVVLSAAARFFEPWKVPALTMPFVLVSWMVLRAAFIFADVKLGPLSAPHLVVKLQAESPIYPISPLFWLQSVLEGVGQIFLIGDPWTGLIFLIGLAVASRRIAALALAGSVIGVVVAVLFGARPEDISSGLYGFNPALTAAAVGAVFGPATLRCQLLALLAAVFTVITHAAFQVTTAPVGVPTLTAPFVVVTWVFLFAMKQESRPAE